MYMKNDTEKVTGDWHVCSLHFVGLNGPIEKHPNSMHIKKFSNKGDGKYTYNGR